MDYTSVEELARTYKCRDPKAVKHLENVVGLLKCWGLDDEVTLSVAWGHDLLEDTKVSERKILAAAGENGAVVLAGIKALTFMTRRERVANLREGSYVMSNEEFDMKKREFLLGLWQEGGMPLKVKLADRICTVEELAEDPTDTDAMSRAIRYMRQAEDLFKGLPTKLNDELLAGKIERSRMRVRALAGDRPIVERMRRRDFVDLLLRYGGDHSDGYYQYTQWENFRRMMAGAMLADGQRHRFVLLTNMKDTNDRVESFWSPRDFVACFSYSKYEDVAMWLNYGRKRGYTPGAVRIHFDRDAVKSWIAEHRKRQESGAREFGVFGVALDEDGNVVASEDISAQVERVCLVDVGYIIHGKFLTPHHTGNVEYRRKFYHITNDDGVGCDWANRVYERKQESDLLPIFKKRGWAYEREVRLIVRLKKGGGVLKRFRKVAVTFDGPFAKLESELLGAKSRKTENRIWRFPILRGPWYDKNEPQKPIALNGGSVSLADATPSDYAEEIKV